MISFFLVEESNSEMSEKEFKRITNEVLMKEYMRYVNAKLLNDPRLENISPDLGKLLSDHSRVVSIMKETQEELNNEFNTHIENYRSELKRNYSIRSRVTQWLNDCVQIEEVNILRLIFLYRKQNLS